MMIKKSNLFLILSIWITLLSCSQKEDRPNILWITHEDLSPEYGCYGDKFAQTPNIDLFAENAIRFTNAYSNAPICAPARSTLITGMYANSLGTQHLRSEIPIPEDLLILPELLRKNGYYTSNNVKTDYNFSPEQRWDDCSKTAHWRNRPEGKPFFSVFNFMITHEGPTNQLNKEDTKSVINKVTPDSVKLPPYLPDSPKMREIWAHKYDLLAVFDQNVGELLKQLEADELMENTIIFIFSDHGTGLPGHKRWLNNAGLKVPFLLHVPKKFEKWLEMNSPKVTDRMVGFVDFAPTVLEMTGSEIPDYMQGKSFAKVTEKGKKFVYGYRDRADDCYDMARAVTDGRFMYVRHFMPQLPYYQNAVIFSKTGSYEEINRLRAHEDLPAGTIQMFKARPAEVLYDLKNDPFEEMNLIDNKDHQSIVDTLRLALNNWMVDNYDTGLLNEGSYMEMARAANSSVYEVVRNLGKDKMKEILDVAQKVGMIHRPEDLMPYLKSTDNKIQYWALVAIDAYDGDIEILKGLLHELLYDDSNVLSSLAAKILIKRDNSDDAYERMVELLQYDYEPVALQTAINVRGLDTLAKPLLPCITEQVFPKYAGDIWGRYRNWSYPMFIGMALDQTRMTCGEIIIIDGK